MRAGVGPDAYRATLASAADFDAAGASPVLNVSRLVAGTPYYARVSAASDRGFGASVPLTAAAAPGGAASSPERIGEGSEEVGGSSIKPYGPPGALPAVSLSHVDGSHLRLSFKQAAAVHGDDVAGYEVRWAPAGSSDAASFHSAALAPDYTVQLIESSVWEGRFEADARFSLTLGDFKGAFVSPLGGLDANGLRTYVSILDGTNNLTRAAPNATDGAGAAALHKSIPRGSFLKVGGQEFRVCLSTVEDVGVCDEAHLPLCRVDDPFVPAFYNGHGYARELARVPAFVLDTLAGAALDVGVGDSTLMTMNGPRERLSVNDLTATLERGDYIRLGHPTEGRTFRVSTDAGRAFNATHLPLADAADASVEVSVLVGDIVSATYEKQVLSFFGDEGDLNKTAGVGGYRLLFANERTETTNAGGVMRSKRGPANDWGRGCLVWDGSAEALEAELESMVSIDDVAVTREAGGGYVNYTVTFHGALVRGDVPQLTITDFGTDGCEAFHNASSYVNSAAPVSFADTTLEPSFTPLYKVQRTEELPYTATAADVKAAVEALTAACSVDVSREIVGSGYSWALTFTSQPKGLLEPVRTNWNALEGTLQQPLLTVHALQRVTLPTPKQGVSYSASAVATNAHGQSGPWQGTSPVALQSAPQLPSAPEGVVVDSISATELSVEWAEPAESGGAPVTLYRVEWDPASTFNSRGDGTALGVATVHASDAKPVTDVQYVSVAVPFGKYLSGSFSLAFNGQSTGELPYDVAPERMQSALQVMDAPSWTRKTPLRLLLLLFLCSTLIHLLFSGACGLCTGALHLRRRQCLPRSLRPRRRLRGLHVGRHLQRRPARGGPQRWRVPRAAVMSKATTQHAHA